MGLQGLVREISPLPFWAQIRHFFLEIRGLYVAAGSPWPIFYFFIEKYTSLSALTYRRVESRRRRETFTILNFRIVLVMTFQYPNERILKNKSQMSSLRVRPFCTSLPRLHPSPCTGTIPSREASYTGVEQLIPPLKVYLMAYFYLGS
jgi:hypothetical protein